MILPITRSFISRQATSVRAADPAHRRLRLLGPVVSGSGPPTTLLQGAEILLSNRDRVAQLAIRLRPAFAWETMQRSHAIANGCFVAAVNRVGHEAPVGGDGIEFWGQSFIVAPSGEILARASVDREEIIFADIEWKRVDEHRTHWPFLRDRRIDAYGGIEQRLLD